MRSVFGFLAFASVLSLSVWGHEVTLTDGTLIKGTAVVHPGYVEVQNEGAKSQFSRTEISGIDGVPLPEEKNPVVRIATEMGDMLIELYEDEAPNTVANFITLAESGFYCGLSFHRVITKFMAQGGCPYSNGESLQQPGTGGPGYSILDEISPNLKHDSRGILSMANAGANTGGSQFFICFEACPWLDGKHAVFGKVVEGWETLDRIEQIATDNGNPKKQVRFNVEVFSKRPHEYKVQKQPSGK